MVYRENMKGRVRAGEGRVDEKVRCTTVSQKAGETGRHVCNVEGLRSLMLLSGEKGAGR